MFLFIVKDTFFIKDHGLILSAESIPNNLKINIVVDLKIITPNNLIIKAKVKGMAFAGSFELLVDKNITTLNVPIGSEVWLDKEYI